MRDSELPPIPMTSSDVSSPVDAVGLSASTAGDPLRPDQEVADAAPDRLEPAIPRRWYLGLGEAFLWFAGTLTVHLIGGFSLLILAVVLRSLVTGAPPAAMVDSQLMLIVTAGEMIAFVMASILAVSLRYWGCLFRELNFRLPEWRHIAIVTCATLPLSICTFAWSLPIQRGWIVLKQIVPDLEIFDGLNAMDMVKDMAQSTPLPLMILIVALLPAIGEELVFRGAIGRVLIAHLGIWSGIILTSTLFGCVHIHPVHALSVIPLGIAMHVIYLWTRSFWMPMLLHFLNNSWASVAAQSEISDPMQRGLEYFVLESIQLFSGVSAVIFLAMALWQSRVRWFRDDGQEWISSQFPVLDPPTPAYRRGHSRISSFCWLAAVVSVVVCHLAVIVDLVGWRPGEN